jgi:tetratricopeptide (TPR) repeat protein
VFYGALAGDRAARMYAKEEAIHSYSRALKALLQMADDKPVDQSLVLEKCGDVYRNSGDYHEAIEKYHAAFNTWEDAEHVQKPESVPWVINQASWNSDLCRKISVSYEYASNYDESALWIDKAVAFLPEDSSKTASRVYAAKSDNCA